MPFKILLDIFTSVLVTSLVLPRLAYIASHIGLMDYPNKRKVHIAKKPLVGGIGIMIGISVSLLLFVPLHNLRGFYAGLLILAIVGFLDDFSELHHIWKFVAQILAALFMVYFSYVMLIGFGDILGVGWLAFNRFAIILTIFSTVGVINSINMIDGIDGLAGGVSLIAFGSFALLAHMDNQAELMLLSIAFCGALIAFLRYNWHPARLFMGDAGSMTLGFAITFIAIALTQHKGSLIPPVAPLLIVAVPIVDTLTMMIKRILKDGDPFRADRLHTHHILHRLGLTQGQAAGAIIAMSALLSSIGVLGTVFEVREYYLFSVFVVYMILHFTASFHVKRMFRYYRRRNRRNRGKASPAAL